jgi:hypothetical protein
MITMCIDGETRRFTDKGQADAFLAKRTAISKAKGRRGKEAYSPRTPDVLEHMASVTDATAREIHVARPDIGHSTVTRILRYLQGEGHVEMVGIRPGRGCVPYYRITMDGIAEVATYG